MGDGMLDLAVEKDFQTTRRQVSNGSGGGGGGPADSASPVTVNGYARPEVVSAMQKAIRRGQEERALYWATELMESNATYHMWRRLLVIAAEDVGLADPDMVPRIMSLKQAHDLGREMNFPFLAIMLLCRSPKNREADDAAYLYELKRKEGWKIKMPPEAVDGHTPAGRSQLHRMANQDPTKSWFAFWCEEFYYDVALLKGYVEQEGGDKYRKLLFDYLNKSPSHPDKYGPVSHAGMKLTYESYDIDVCSKPRIRSGGKARQAEEDAIASRIPVEAQWEELKHDPATGEAVDPDVLFAVESFTDEGTAYIVDLRGTEHTCTCPAYANRPGSVCKHLLLIEQRRSR